MQLLSWKNRIQLLKNHKKSLKNKGYRIQLQDAKPVKDRPHKEDTQSTEKKTGEHDTGRDKTGAVIMFFRFFVLAC